MDDAPRLIKRRCGGWLAVSNDRMSLKIGVSGEDERDARERFAASLADWRKSLAMARHPFHREAVAADFGLVPNQ